MNQLFITVLQGLWALYNVIESFDHLSYVLNLNLSGNKELQLSQKQWCTICLSQFKYKVVLT